MNTILGYTRELLPNGMISKSTTRLGFFLVLILAGFLIIEPTLVSQYESHILLSKVGTTICITQGDKDVYIQPVTIRDYIDANKSITGLSVTLIIFLVGTAFTGKAASKYVEGLNLSEQTPDLTQPDLTSKPS